MRAALRTCERHLTDLQMLLHLKPNPHEKGGHNAHTP